MLFLKHVDGFKVAKETLVIPRIAWVMDLLIGPFIGEEDFPRIGPDVGERIKNVPGVTSQPLTVY